MKLLTPENDTRLQNDAWLISHWANRLYDATVNRDFNLRNHLKRQLPRGILAKILVREAELAIKNRKPRF